MTDLQVPAGNNGQAAADEGAARVPPHPPDNLGPADPQEAENHRADAEHDDEDEVHEEEEEVRIQDGNNAGQGECDSADVELLQSLTSAYINA